MVSEGDESFLFSDITLARRLEMAEARSNAGFVEARSELSPESQARWITVAGAYAMFDGVSSPLTQTFGLGLFQTPSAIELDEIEMFFQERGAPVFHEISPLADLALLTMLNQRGYRPVEFTSVMYQPIRSGGILTGSGNERIQLRVAHEGEEELWARTAARGWSESGELSGFMLEIGRICVRRPETVPFMAELDRRPIATGVLCLSDGVALLAGASTVPEKRKLGAQLALLDGRLRYAARQGCDIAMMCTLPGSASQRNAERHGFRIAYTRVKWHLDLHPS
jgi:hypothetical protein